MSITDYPKVLIICQTFNYTSGSGITKANLLKEWPVDRIAAATFEKVVENVICKNYFKLVTGN